MSASAKTMTGAPRRRPAPKDTESEQSRQAITVDAFTLPSEPYVASPEDILPKVKLIETDGIPMESPWHLFEIYLLAAVLTYRWRDRNDYYVGGNMFIYYTGKQAESIVADPVGTTAFKGPDFFYVSGVNRHPLRKFWVTWEEGGRYPDLIMEFISPSTAKTDRTTKKELYEGTFKTHEYFLYDPDTQKMEGWRLGGEKHYRKIKPDRRGWLWSEELNAWLGIWTGHFLGYERSWLRLYNADGQLLPLPDEAAAEQAEAERQRAQAERQRAEAAEREVNRLKVQLAKGRRKR